MTDPSRSPTRRKILVGALALVPTPLLLALSPALRLYLENQGDLHHQTGVLAPFALLALGIWAVGGVVSAGSSRPSFRFLAWAYLLAAPFWLGFRFLSEASLPSLLGLLAGWWTGTLTGLLFHVAALLGAAALAARRVQPNVVAAPMASFGVVLLAVEAFTFVTGIDGRPASRATVSASEPVAGDGSGPNVYHIVLDALQTEALELVRSPELDAELRGFVVFPENRSIYHSTLMSLASTFASATYAYERPRADFIADGFGPLSVAARFAEADYRTVALVPESDPVSAGDESFDEVLRHAELFERSTAANHRALRNLFWVATLPDVLLESLLASGWLNERLRDELRLTRAGRALTDAAPLTSAMSFRKWIGEERRSAAMGRYVFVHLLLPHSPYVLADDCTYEAERAPVEDPLPQTRCSLRLVAELLEALSESGRFEESIVVVHGDHGEPYRLREGSFVRARARSVRTPLLVKPKGVGRSRELTMCETPSTLLDVAPTLLDLAGLAAEPAFMGTSLEDPLEACLENAP